MGSLFQVNALNKKKERFKILFILDNPLSEWKGTQKMVYELGLHLMRKGNEVVLIERNHVTEYSLKREIKAPFKIISIDFNILSSFLIIKKWVKELKPDLIYSSNIINPLIPLIGTKTIFGSHVLNVTSLPYLKIREKMTFYFKQTILVLTSFFFWPNKNVMFHTLNLDQTNWIRRIYFGRYAIETIGNPINCPEQDIAQIIKEKNKGKKFRILFFGAIDASRGFSSFMKIVQLISNDSIMDKIEFLIAGSGTMEHEARSMVQEFKNVRFLYKPDEDQKKSLFLNSELFLFLSYIENFSITTVEAQLYGIPAIISNTTPLLNIVEDKRTGYSFPPFGSEDSIVEKIKELVTLWEIDFEAYREMSEYTAETSRRLCKENVLPIMERMITKFVRNQS